MTSFYLWCRREREGLAVFGALLFAALAGWGALYVREWALENTSVTSGEYIIAVAVIGGYFAVLAALNAVRFPKR